MTWAITRSGLVVPDYIPAPPPAPPVGIDLFAGAGGFSCGFHQAGWHVAAALEWDKHAAATYLCNLGTPDTVVHFTDGRPAELAGSNAGTGWLSHGEDLRAEHPEICTDPVLHFWHGDVTKVTGAEILDALGMHRGDVDAVFGGPPCQGFSSAGQRDVMDPRNSLVFEFGRLILEIEPKTFVMENVPGIMNMVTPDGLPVLDALALMLAEGGFGAYNTLRRSLGSMPSARGAIRNPYRPNETAVDDEADEDPAGQLDLFAEAPA